MYLETSRLVIRKFEEQDFADYCAYSLGEPDLDRLMGRDLLRTVEDVQLNFDWLKDKEERGYVLEEKKTGKVIGDLTVYNKPPVSNLPQLQGKTGRALSFCLSRAYRRQGLMEEAVQAVIRNLFLEEGVDYINCGCFDFNLPSLAFQQKLGFTHLTTERFTTDRFTAEEEEFVCLEHILWKESFLS